jgi:hypothetical protein
MKLCDWLNLSEKRNDSTRPYRARKKPAVLSALTAHCCPRGSSTGRTVVQRPGSPCTRRLGLRPRPVANHGAEVRFFTEHHSAKVALFRDRLTTWSCKQETMWCGRQTADRSRLDVRAICSTVIAESLGLQGRPRKCQSGEANREGEGQARCR